MLLGLVNTMTAREKLIVKTECMRRLLLFSIGSLLLLNSCSLLHIFGGGKEKNGCPMGRNVGAEKILSGDPKAIKAAKKAGNYKAYKGL